MADYAALLNAEKKKSSPSPTSPTPSSVGEKKQKEQQPPQRTQQRIPIQSTEQSINQSINRLPDLLTHRPVSPPGGKVMDKPRGFYITERLNKRIDEAVRYYQEKHNIQKVDRSIVVTVLLDNEANWTEEALDLLLDKVISQLTSRLTNR